MQLGLFDILLMLGVIQGVLLSIILFTHKSNRAANRLLGGAMFFLSLEIFYLFINKNNVMDNFIYFIPLLFPLPFIYTPLLFLYVKELTTEEGTQKRDMLHSIPFLISFLLILSFYFVNNLGWKDYLYHVSKGDLLFTYITNNAKPIYAVAYIFYMLVYIKKYNMRIVNSFSNLDRINLNWLRNFAIAMIIITVIVLVQNVSEFIYDEKSVLEIYLFAALVVLIYLIGYFGLKQPEIFSQIEKDNSSEIKSPDRPRQRHAKYQKSGLDDNSADEYLKILLNYMETEKPYLNGDLTLQELAGRCNISVHHLSETINSKLNQSYYDFVNKYRVEEFKRKLNEPGNNKFTILSIAYDCGFNSKSSFNTIFKKFTANTPSEYRKSLLKN